MQFGFMPEKVGINSVYVEKAARRVLLLSRKKLYMYFLDLEKWSDSIPKKCRNGL